MLLTKLENRQKNNTIGIFCKAFFIFFIYLLGTNLNYIIPSTVFINLCIPTLHNNYEIIIL